MDGAARRWFDSHTFDGTRFQATDLIRAKQHQGQSVSVVIPARNEAATVAAVVTQIRQALQVSGLVDELVVLDSDSTDDTAAVARAAGATVVAARDIETGTPPSPGKGEALWKSLFVTSGDLLVFIDADLTEWGPHFVTGLLGPLLLEEQLAEDQPSEQQFSEDQLSEDQPSGERPPGERILLTKGFYDRLADDLPDAAAALPQGGRVTELVARPLLNLYWPELAAVVQPLAGEWAVRRSLIESLPIPVGYGVEFASLTDTWRRHGLPAIAQVDLGRRGHRHQNVHDLGVMAAEILATAMRRLPREAGGPRAATEPGAPSLQQYDRHAPHGWRSRPVPVAERPAARTNPRYPNRTAARCSS
jgi:glucosyl-3-phosphoglycerate synthase